MENKFKRFNESFLKPLKVQWFDKVGYLKLNENINVKIYIDDVGVHGNFNGYRVEIIHRGIGTIDKHFFRFKDYIEFCDNSRITTKNSHVWENGDKFDWYINKPINSKNYLKVLQDFINIYR